jgi:hypothetical protein
MHSLYIFLPPISGSLPWLSDYLPGDDREGISINDKCTVDRFRIFLCWGGVLRSTPRLRGAVVPCEYSMRKLQFCIYYFLYNLPRYAHLFTSFNTAPIMQIVGDVFPGRPVPIFEAEVIFVLLVMITHRLWVVKRCLAIKTFCSAVY